jgi:hypothetical protein
MVSATFEIYEKQLSQSIPDGACGFSYDTHHFTIAEHSRRSHLRRSIKTMQLVRLVVTLETFTIV